MKLKHLSNVNKLKNGSLFHTKWSTLRLCLLLFISLFICIRQNVCFLSKDLLNNKIHIAKSILVPECAMSIAEENLYPSSNYVLELLEKERKNNVCIILLCKLKCAYKRNDKTNKQAAINRWPYSTSNNMQFINTCHVTSRNTLHKDF